MKKGAKSLMLVSAVAAIFVIGVIFSMFSAGGIPGQLLSPTNSQKSSPNNTAVASQNIPPRLVLTVLKNDEDGSEGAVSYDSNNTNPISLDRRQHIRFDSPDYRLPDSMKVIAKDSGGNIHILLKSYDVNNEFFINVTKGNYQLQVQARWIDKTFSYPFTVKIE